MVSANHAGINLIEKLLRLTMIESGQREKRDADIIQSCFAGQANTLCGRSTLSLGLCRFSTALWATSLVNELDTLEHFLFGFVLFDLASKTVNATKLSRFLNRKLGQKGSRRTDLLTRLLGFLLIGALLWELSELFIFPNFGSKPDPFFSFPITPTNVDGATDVTVGVVGCSIAWYQAKQG